MAYFLIVIALDLTQIACRSAQTIPVSIIVFFLIGLTRLGCVDFGGRGGAFLISSVLLLLSAAVLLLPLSLSGRLWVTGTGSCFRGPGLKFFYPKVLYRLGLSLGHQDVHRSIASVAWLIEVSASGGLYLGLGLNSDCFFDQSIPTIQISAFLVNS